MQAYTGCDQFGYPIIADPKRELAIQLGMLDPAEKDKAGLPLAARAVSTETVFDLNRPLINLLFYFMIFKRSWLWSVDWCVFLQYDIVFHVANVCLGAWNVIIHSVSIESGCWLCLVMY